MKDRRWFLCNMACGLCAAAHVAHAQNVDRIIRVGILSSANKPLPSDATSSVWFQSLRELGWVEGQNIVFERRYADGRNGLLTAFAQELVQARVDVIATFASFDTVVAKRTTSVIPIVMVFNGLDPVEEGFIASFARPGGNITGVSRMLAETRAKRLELIKAMLPAASRIAVLAPPQLDAGRQAGFESRLRSAARVAQVELQFFQYRSQDDLLAALPAIVGARMHAFLLEPTFQTFENRGRITDLALKLQLPGVFPLGEYATAGGLLSYGPDWSSMLKQHVRLVDRILRGANPADLPMEQPTKFDLVVNLKTAKALGITIPQSLLLRADEVIQ